MSTTGNNKLIAEFMGWYSRKINVTASRPKGEGIELYLKEITEYNKEFEEDDLKFHSDWNWLIEVVEKIESLDNNFIIEGNKGFINIPQRKQVEVRKETKIEAVYNACVEFIKWYNEQSK